MEAIFTDLSIISIPEPSVFEAMLEALADQKLSRIVQERLNERENAIEVDIDAI